MGRDLFYSWVKCLDRWLDMMEGNSSPNWRQMLRLFQKKTGSISDWKRNRESREVDGMELVDHQADDAIQSHATPLWETVWHFFNTPNIFHWFLFSFVFWENGKPSSYISKIDTLCNHHPKQPLSDLLWWLETDSKPTLQATNIGILTWQWKNSEDDKRYPFPKSWVPWWAHRLTHQQLLEGWAVAMANPLACDMNHELLKSWLMKYSCYQLGSIITCNYKLNSQKPQTHQFLGGLLNQQPEEIIWISLDFLVDFLENYSDFPISCTVCRGKGGTADGNAGTCTTAASFACKNGIGNTDQRWNIIRAALRFQASR